MKCDVCGNTTFCERNVQEIFNLEGHLVLVEGIPARVCERCGETTFARETVESIRLMAHGTKQPTRRENVDVFAFAS